MTRNSLAKEVAEHTYLPQKLVRNTLDIAIDRMAAALSRGEPIELRGFGRFSVATRAERKGFGFWATKERLVVIPRRRVAKFKAHDVVLRALATGEEPPVTPPATGL